jgi:NAD(P) transhydrogenase subunit alpha
MDNILEFVFSYRQEIFILILAIFLGIEVISNVPSVLHTPLMSGANAISGVIIIGGIILLGHADLSKISITAIIGIIAVFFATLNVAGGFVVTDRMLEMFKKRKTNQPK